MSTATSGGHMSTATSGGLMSTTHTLSHDCCNMATCQRHKRALTAQTGAVVTPNSAHSYTDIRFRCPPVTGHLPLLLPSSRGTTESPRCCVDRHLACTCAAARDHRRPASAVCGQTLACVARIRACAARSTAATALRRAAPPISKPKITFLRAHLTSGTSSAPCKAGKH